MTQQEMEDRIKSLEQQLAASYACPLREAPYTRHLHQMRDIQSRLGHDNGEWAHGVGKGLNDILRGTLGIRYMVRLTDDEQKTATALLGELVPIIEKYNWKNAIRNEERRRRAPWCPICGG